MNYSNILLPWKSSVNHQWPEPFFEEIYLFYKRTGLLSEDFSEYQGAKCIYDVIIAETIAYLMQDAITFEEYTESIQRLINFIFILVSFHYFSRCIHNFN